jgi:hypothetical protein
MTTMILRRACASLIALLLGLSLVVQGALPARACSCMAPDPYGGLEEADGAFVGTLIETDRGQPVADTGTLIDYVFDVETVLKGDIGDTITVKSAADGAACGFEMPLGERAGILLHRVDGQWEGNLCWTLDADTLLAVADGPPAPVTGASPHVIVSAYLGSAGLVALDRDGRIVGYGEGEPSWLMDDCPDDVTFIGTGDGTTVRRWSFADLRQVGEVDLGIDAGSGFYNLVCTGPDEFYALSATQEAADLPQMVLTRISGDSAEVVSDAVESLIQTDNSLLAIGYDGVINRIDPATGALTPITSSIGDVRGKLAGVTPSPVGKHLAATLVDWNSQPYEAGVVVVDLETDDIARRSTDCDVYPVWLDQERLTFADCVSGRYQIYTAELDQVGPGHDPWPSGSGAAVDEDGVTYIPTETGVDRFLPGSDQQQRWAMLATWPNQVMVVPEAARAIWIGSDFVPATPSVTTETTPGIRPAPPGTLGPINVDVDVDSVFDPAPPPWLVVLAAGAVMASLWMILRRPRPGSDESRRQTTADDLL